MYINANVVRVMDFTDYDEMGLSYGPRFLYKARARARVRYD